LADLLCPAGGGGASGTVSHLWSAARVHGGHSTRWRSADYAAWRAGSM